MANIYWRTIKRGTRTLNDVPEKLQADVIVLAKQDVENGIISAAEYAELIGEEYTA